jgi:hypothetical protein
MKTTSRFKWAILAAVAVGISLMGLQFTPGGGPKKSIQTSELRDSLKTLVDTPVSVKGKKVLFVGDSHTAYSGGWQDRLASRTGMIRSNTAVGGKRTDWMVQTALRQIISHRFDYCFVWGGANDMASKVSIKSAVKNIQSIVDLCLKNGVKPVVLTGFNPIECIDVSRSGPEWKDYPQKYSQFQRVLQDSIRGAAVVKSHFISRGDKDCSDFICHMSASGHRKMADSLIKVLKFKTIK